MIRILISGLSSEYGGIESIIINIMKHIDKDKFRFDFVLSSNKKCKFESEIEAHGGKIYNVTPWGKNPFKYAYDIKSIFRENSNYDFVWINTSAASIITLQKVTRKFTNAKIIVHSHGTSFETGGFLKKNLLLLLHKINYRKFLKLIDYQFACSVEAANWLFSKRMIESKKFTIIKNAIESEKYVYNFEIRKKYREKYGLLNKFVIIHVGRITKVKNHTFLIDIFNEICKKGQNSVLMIVGDGDLEHEAINKVKNLKLEDKVMFMGPRNDVSGLLQAADIFVLPSLSEGLPLVTIEAQASGLKSIVSNAVPLEAKITDLVEHCSLDHPPEFWAKVILEAKEYDRRDTRKEIVRAGFDISNEVKEIENLLFVMG